LKWRFGALRCRKKGGELRKGEGRGGRRAEREEEGEFLGWER